MTDEEAAVIEAARLVDRLFFPQGSSADIPLSQVHAAITGLHFAVHALEQKQRVAGVGK